MAEQQDGGNWWTDIPRGLRVTIATMLAAGGALLFVGQLSPRRYIHVTPGSVSAPEAGVALLSGLVTGLLILGAQHSLDRKADERSRKTNEQLAEQRKIMIASLSQTVGFAGLDLSGVELAGVPLTGSMEDTKLSRARLNGTLFIRATMDRCDLSGASMDNALFTSCVGVRVNGNNASFRGANISGLSVGEGSSFDRANFTGATCTGLRVSPPRQNGVGLPSRTGLGYWVSFRHAVFDFADLRTAEWRAGDMTGATFRGALLEGTRLQGANLTRAVFSMRTATGEQGAMATEIRGTRFSYARLQGAQFIDCCLDSCDFSHADARGADFSTSTHVNCDWSNCLYDETTKWFATGRPDGVVTTPSAVYTERWGENPSQ